MNQPSSAATTLLHVPLPADAPPGVYVHVPFCRHICPYCDFNTYSGQEALVPRYVAALLEEMRLLVRAEPERAGRGAPTLFFGGGTPSLLPAADVARLIEGSRAHFGLRTDAEVTLEANPESVDAAYLEGIRAAGVNRLSLGVQSQRRAGLRVLGRGHKSLEAGQAFMAAREAGFENISLDFIYGWPGQTADDWEADLATLLEWQPEHVSLYALIVEPGTPLHAAVQRGILTPVEDDRVADFHERALEVLAAAGWEHYEIANWAREPRYRSRHNQLYWQNSDYFGLGAGAHFHHGNLRGGNLLLPAAYCTAVERGELPRMATETLSADTALGESLMLGLRLLVDGVGADDIRARHGVDLAATYAAEIARFTALSLLEWHAGSRLRLTPRGALLANEVCAAFLR
ncbi:MAG: coproporphyrinogen III oxidase [Chloroflexi bacterium]|nr:MAG: coproporphyrinogen III oxidase [Chloroflexota bacterium]